MIIKVAFFFLYKKEPDFTDLIKNCKGFCLHHLGYLMEASRTCLSEKEMPAFTGKVYRYSGKQVEWYHNEHCVVLYGFDLTNNTVLVSDPIDGLVERELDRFREIYEKAGRMAMVII